MLLFEAYAERALVSVPYAVGHGASAERLGAGSIYYVITCMARARTCVCLGSGGGFVPCLMRQAQRDLNIEMSETFLVDAVLPEAGFGGPDVEMGWIDERSLIRREFEDVVILSCRTDKAAAGFFAKNATLIDYLHIDADHSFDAALADIELYFPLLGPAAFVTMHDTATDSIQKVLSTILFKHPELQCIDLQDVGAGLAILRRRVASSRPAEAQS